MSNDSVNAKPIQIVPRFFFKATEAAKCNTPLSVTIWSTLLCILGCRMEVTLAKAKTTLTFLLLLVSPLAVQANHVRATIIYDDVATQVSAATDNPTELWISTADLTRATRFELKPQGVCRDELCFPVPKARAQEFVRKNSGVTSFNLLTFAQLVSQPVAHDDALSTWYFGLRADQRQGLASLQAPSFTLPDVAGKMHSLSDFRGKKVLLVTWASW